MTERYEPASFEAQWQQRWREADLFRAGDDPSKPKFYGLEFFPYPSGAGLSVGHCRNYVPTDVICRMRKMQGYNVLHPMGFDAFGLPAENQALKLKTHPEPMIEEYAGTYRRQLELIGNGYDWSRTFKSSDPDYYRWTQWIFELLYKRGLAYRRPAEVNWCPKDKTALANEEVVGGLCERCGTPVEKRNIPQWFFRITEYAQRLLDDLEELEWPEGIKAQQRNWIGRSEGVQFSMRVLGPKPEEGPFQVKSERAPTFEVFTTRVDTIYGMSFCVVAPEHPLVDQVLAGVEPAIADQVRAYRDQAKGMSDIARQATDRDKTGTFLGVYAENPATGAAVPIYVADYVMMGYGTGAIMAVPAGDQRDFEFAVQFGLPVIPIQEPDAEWLRANARNPDSGDLLADYLADPKRFKSAFISKEAPLINARQYTGLPFEAAARGLAEWMEQEGIGERKVQYKLRDWLISRQRYWGCPIPIIHTKDGEMQPVPEDCLPVLLPEVDNYEPSGDGSSPLASIDEFVNVTDLDGRLGRRETDTMGGFACSSWYFLRFIDPHNDAVGWDPAKSAYWMPVDCYVGGAEHAVMHLLYARFWTKVLYDAGLVTVKEPFARLENQGQVLALTPYRKPREGERLDVGEDGILVSFAEATKLSQKELTWRWVRMSKSKGNVVTPEEAVEQFGADALRMYLLFVAPFHADVQWSNEGMQGQVRFLHKVFRLVNDLKAAYDPSWQNRIPFEDEGDAGRKIRRLTHKTVRKATEDIERFAFNTYVSSLMIFVNELGDLKSATAPLAQSEALESLILLLSPGAPHSADELWQGIGRSGFTYEAEWPAYDDALAADDTVTVAIQVNGKLRDTVELPVGLDQAGHEAAAKASAKVAAHLEGKMIRKVIVVPGKLVNLVAN